MLQHLFDLLWRVSPADLFQDRFALQSVRQSRPHKHSSEVDAYDVCQSSDFLGSDPQIAPEMTTSDRQSGNQVMVTVHNALVVDQVVKNPQNLRNFVVLCLLA